MSFDLFDGNQTDDKTHVPNWKGLRELLSKEEFFYIADCKLCSMENLDHIHANGGNFSTYKTFESATAREEYRMIWVHSSSKEKQIVRKQSTPGRPGPNTVYYEQETPTA